MEERIGRDEDLARPIQEQGAAPKDAAEDVGLAPEKPARAHSTVHGSAGEQLLTLAMIGLALMLLMLAVWVGEPA
jgi:hypothetical protein